MRSGTPLDAAIMRAPVRFSPTEWLVAAQSGL